MVREHEAGDKGKEREASRSRGSVEDIREYMERLCDGYKKGKYVDEAMFYRVQEDFKEYTDEDLVLIRRSSMHRL